MTEQKLDRVIHNYFTAKANGDYTYGNIATVKEFIKLLVDVNTGVPKNIHLPRYKVGLMFICLNQPYWEFAKEAVEGAAKYFLPDHDTECMIWSDMPLGDNPQLGKALEKIKATKKKGKKSKEMVEAEKILHEAMEESKKQFGATVFPTEPVQWPYPTLLRYHLFLAQEEYLKKFDYIFYCDLDMKFVNIVGDEILGQGLTAALHPGYAVRKEYWPPYEPNDKSASFIPRPGKVINDQGKPRFMPMYFAGGLQGGKTGLFLQAMHDMKKLIDTDLNVGYIPIWNDETAWNKYLSMYPPDVVLTPSYIYPDSLINEYYRPLWGCDYPPKLVTLTKKFSVSREGAEAVAKVIQETKPLQ